MAEFEDLSDFIKKHYHVGLFKKKGEVKSVGNRLSIMNKKRRSNRHEAVFEKRKIPANMSPVTPLQPPKKAKKRTPAKIEPKPEVKPETNKRYEMMLKWKADREKLKAAQKKNAKPVFKVSSVSANIGLPDLENVNKEIKGKLFDNKSKFAPANHQFKPPSNIKPLYFHNSGLVPQKTENNASKFVTPQRMITRSQARAQTSSTISTTSVNSNKSTKSSAKTIKNTAPRSTKAPSPQKIVKKNVATTKSTSAQRNNTKTPQTNTKLKKTEIKLPQVEPKITVLKENVKTPERKQTPPPTYVSPFVTVSRGKNSARKEFVSRKSGISFGDKVDADCSSPKAGAAYFRWMLNNQIARLQGCCDEWIKYKDEPTLAEEAVSMIDVAIGQTNLLITKKFMQFQGLIDKCQEGNSDTRVTCEDLHGFWDMMNLQIVNVDKRFENLDNLRNNGWEEILPVVKKVVKKKTTTAKNAKASAGLRAAIQAARKNMEPKDNGEKTPKKRDSCRVSVLKSQEKDKRKSSPGLMMMKVAQYAKTVETPGKSILKTEGNKSIRSERKTVLFIDDTNASIQDLENDINRINSDTKGKTRRSGRLTRSKLF